MKALSTLLAAAVAAVGLGLGGGTLFVVGRAGPHATLGTFSELLVPTLVTVAIIAASVAACFGGAWVLWRRNHKMASQLLGGLAALAPLLVWQGADAANVLLDSSPPAAHDTALLERRRTKGIEYFVLRSWRDPDETLMIDTSDIVWDPVELGAPAVLVVRAGAFGRPYAVSLSPREDAGERAAGD